MNLKFLGSVIVCLKLDSNLLVSYKIKKDVFILIITKSFRILILKSKANLKTCKKYAIVNNIIIGLQKERIYIVSLT